MNTNNTNIGTNGLRLHNENNNNNNLHISYIELIASSWLQFNSIQFRHMNIVLGYCLWITTDSWWIKRKTFTCVQLVYNNNNTNTNCISISCCLCVQSRNNNRFRIDNTDHIFDVNKNAQMFDYDQVDIVCPQPPRQSISPNGTPTDQQQQQQQQANNNEQQSERYIIYNVSRQQTNNYMIEWQWLMIIVIQETWSHSYICLLRLQLSLCSTLCARFRVV